MYTWTRIHGHIWKRQHDMIENIELRLISVHDLWTNLVCTTQQNLCNWTNYPPITTVKWRQWCWLHKAPASTDADHFSNADERTTSTDLGAEVSTRKGGIDKDPAPYALSLYYTQANSPSSSHLGRSTCAHVCFQNWTLAWTLSRSGDLLKHFDVCLSFWKIKSRSTFRTLDRSIVLELVNNFIFNQEQHGNVQRDHNRVRFWWSKMLI